MQSTRNRGEPAVQVAQPDQVARLREIGIPRAGRPVEEVMDELTSQVLPYRARMDHPRFFAFIPSPSSSLASKDFADEP